MADTSINIPDHSIIAILGKGGMATVYLARDEKLRRQVALKVMDTNLGEQDPSFVKRFVREAQTAASLTHPHIVPVYQYGETQDGHHWLTMAYLDGGSLKDRLNLGPMGAEEAIGVCRQIAQALVPAHARNIVHRDLKPDNILFHGESASLTDFGIAKLLDASTQLTELGSPGTVRYMSPEQAWGEPVEQRSDLYSLGVVLYEMLTGRLPTSGGSMRAVVANIAHEAPAPLEGALAGLQPLLNLMLAKDPADRIGSSPELVRLLTAVQRKVVAGVDISHATDGIEMITAGNPAPVVDQAPLRPVRAAAEPLVTPGQPVAPTTAVEAVHSPGREPEPTELVRPQLRRRGRWLLVGSALGLALVAGVWWWLTLDEGALRLDTAALGGATTQRHVDGVGTGAAQSTQPGVGQTFNDRLRDGGKGPQMVVVPRGSFSMGSNADDSGEQPVHTVSHAHAFAVGVFEVTFDDFDRFARATNRRLPNDKGWGRGRRPVIMVSWEEAQAYVEWLSTQTGAHYRLPSESEWEYVTRAGSTSGYTFGDRAADLCRHANVADRSTDYFWRIDCNDGVGKQSAPVGSYLQNKFGLHDVHGNVFEWVQDCYADNYSLTPRDGSAFDAPACSARVVRGGSWMDLTSLARSADRSRYAPVLRSSTWGLRVARTL